MSVTPLPTPSPLIGAQQSPASSGDATTGSPASGFGALVAALLGRSASPAMPVTPLAGSKAAALGDAVMERPADADDEAALLQEDLPTPTLNAALAAQLAVAAVAARVQPAAVPTTTAPTPVTAQIGVEATAPATPGPTTADPLSGVPTPASAPASTPAAPDDAMAMPDATSAGTTERSGLVVVAPATTTEAVPAQAPTPLDAPTAGTGVTASVPLAAPAATPAPTTAPAQAAPVAAQVFPEVTRLVTTGNGTHRVTLQLEPEALGEVRVILTVRDGAVHVRLAAGSEAQHALLEGAPELRRLLELTGASDTRIVVRDLPSGAAPGATAPSTTSLSGGAGTALSDGSRTGQGGADGQGAPGQHAGTRGGGSTAKDGMHDGATPLRHVDQVTRARSAGVDVTV